MGAKGGIGKTFVSTTMAQFLVENGKKPPICVDLDYKNVSFGRYKSLNVTILDLETDGDIEKRKFDVLIERIAGSKEDDTFVLDCGGNIYVPLNNYMLTNDVYNMLLDMGHQLLLHVPVMGGDEIAATMATLREVCTCTPPAAMVAVWLNTYHGLIESGGKNFEQSETYKECKERIYTIVEIPKFRDDMRHDVSELLKSKKTFDEGINSQSGSVMERQRLKQAKRLLFESITAARVCE
jgi:hypothetical protein